jgi:hypothetical protein
MRVSYSSFEIAPRLEQVLRALDVRFFHSTTSVRALARSASARFSSAS